MVAVPFLKPSSSFATNVLKLVTGSVFSQGLGVLVAPIVARLFAPEAFGVAALFASIAGIVGVVACLRYELAIMLAPTLTKNAEVYAILKQAAKLALAEAKAVDTLENKYINVENDVLEDHRLSVGT